MQENEIPLVESPDKIQTAQPAPDMSVTPSAVVLPETQISRPLPPVEEPIKSGLPTTPPNKQLLWTGAGFIALLIALLYMINMLGLRTSDYASVRNYESFAGYIGWILAITSGVLIAYCTTHPRKTKHRGTNLRYFLIVCGFVLGAIPGFILAMIITYPLSAHACRLSGSKYC